MEASANAPCRINAPEGNWTLRGTLKEKDMDKKSIKVFASSWERARFLRYPPRREDVNFRDVFHILSRIFRFGGHSDVTVAAHSVRVAERLPLGIQAYGLLHDAHEAWIGDVSMPFVNWLHQDMASEGIFGLHDSIHDLKERIDCVVWSAAGLARPSEEAREAIEEADGQEALRELAEGLSGGRIDPSNPIRTSFQDILRKANSLGIDVG